ncbi:hypothetical protein DF051_25595 [Burkholderia contaminans]|uniref:Uncharacterized protein n=1 Tax=Burkholderia contaminans TaxID=488447 RepID=A0A3N8PIF0_9BURK|nr:hypothetical protein DF051_25595 [Burkholderia contaminans]
MKRGFLFSIKRNQSQVTRIGRKARWPGARCDGARSPAGTTPVHRSNRRQRHRPHDFFSGLARDYWCVIKGFP